MNRTLPGQIARVCILPALLLVPALLTGQRPYPCVDSPKIFLYPDFAGQVYVVPDNLCFSNGPGIEVQADGVTIDLAGKTLFCSGSPLGCQGNSLAVGIDVGSHKNVTIKDTIGLGRIEGFHTGILVDKGDRVRIESLTITGTHANFDAFRGDATGILVKDVACPGAILIDGNDVSWHRYGIRLLNSSCVKIQRNIVHHNNNNGGEAYGILLSGLSDPPSVMFGSSGNTITNNTLTYNGFHNTYGSSGEIDAGLVLDGRDTTGNRVSQNTVLSNCGDGIMTRQSASGNTVSNNTVHDNPTQSNGPEQSCSWPSPTQLRNYDLASRGAGENRWSKTNDCGVSFGILPGVCIVSK